MSRSAVAWVIFRVFGSVVIVPLAEELAFRGYLVRRLIAADFESVPVDRFTWPSFLISSLLFGAMHQALDGRYHGGHALCSGVRTEADLATPCWPTPQLTP